MQVVSFSKVKQSGGTTIIQGGSGGTGGGNVNIDIDEIINALGDNIVAARLNETHKLWGQDFNGTQDISGDLTSTGTITGENGNFSNTKTDNISSKTENGTINVNSNTDINANLNVDGTSTLNGEVNATGGVYISNNPLNVTSTSYLADVNTNNVTPSANNTYDLGSATNRYKKLYTKDIDNSGDIVTKNLTVTGSAHFFELIIDKIKSVGGAALFTPADGFTIDRVVDGGTYYIFYWNINLFVWNIIWK